MPKDDRMDWVGSADGYYAAGVASVAPEESVFYACQLAREVMQRAGGVPDWLILGEEEWTRLLEEVSALVPAAEAGDLDRVTEFQGMHVARYAVPSHLEVIARAR